MKSDTANERDGFEAKTANVGVGAQIQKNCAEGHRAKPLPAKFNRINSAKDI